MHEFALAQAVVDATLAAAREAGLSRITRVCVRLGELQRIDPDSFAFVLREMLQAEARLDPAVVAVEREPARFRCRPCECTFTLADTRSVVDDDASEAIHFVPELAHAFLRCPACRSPDFEVVGGRGVVIDSLEGDT